MAEQKNPQDRRDEKTKAGATELDDQQLDQAAGGTIRGTTDVVGAPKAAYADKLGGIAKGVAQVGLDVEAN